MRLNPVVLRKLEGGPQNLCLFPVRASLSGLKEDTTAYGRGEGMPRGQGVTVNGPSLQEYW